MKKEVIHIRIDEDIKKEIIKIAKENDRSLNNMIAIIIKEYVKGKKK